MERVSRRQNRPLLREFDPRGVMRRLIERALSRLRDRPNIEVRRSDISKEEMAANVVAGDRRLPASAGGKQASGNETAGAVRRNDGNRKMTMTAAAETVPSRSASVPTTS
jgi:hypothetical protein